MRVRVRNRTVTLIALATVVLLASPLVRVVQAQWITSFVAGAPGRGSGAGSRPLARRPEPQGDLDRQRRGGACGPGAGDARVRCAG